MEMFVTILAYIFTVVCLVRILAVTFADRTVVEQAVLDTAKSMGQNIIFDTIKLPALVLIVCVVWIITTFIN